MLKWTPFEPRGTTLRDALAAAMKTDGDPRLEPGALVMFADGCVQIIGDLNALGNATDDWERVGVEDELLAYNTDLCDIVAAAKARGEKAWLSILPADHRLRSKIVAREPLQSERGS